MRTFLIAMLLVFPALATPPSTALFGQIGADQVAVYAGPGPVDTCIYMEQKKPGDEWYGFTGPLCAITQATIDSYGGAAGLVTAYLPAINARFATQYSGGGGDAGAQINSALTTAFKFTGVGNPAVSAK